MGKTGSNDTDLWFGGMCVDRSEEASETSRVATDTIVTNKKVADTSFVMREDTVVTSGQVADTSLVMVDTTIAADTIVAADTVISADTTVAADTTIAVDTTRIGGDRQGSTGVTVDTTTR